ncbi:MAG: GDP-L-fucose synthase [Oligoflexia bacterium]|nr:GDP-L-fucose synthase [Oligoflexia bacterium]
MRDKSKKIFVAGHKGLVGSAIVKVCKDNGYSNILTRTREELNLTNASAVEEFFKKERPQYVFIAAAKVGGIHANSTYPVQFLLDNLKIECNLIESSAKYEAEKVLFLGSSCIYPRLAPQPLKEEYLLTGLLEPTNEAYAISKIAGIKLCRAYYRQYGKNFISVMPCNLYGPNDNYHPTESHVLPALIRRFHFAKLNNDKEVVVWGTGKPLREFLYSLDCAEACLFLMENCDASEIGEFINIGSGREYPIASLVEYVKKTVGYQGNIVFDHTKPDGTPRKVMDISRITALGWRPKFCLEDGLALAYEDFLKKM